MGRLFGGSVYAGKFLVSRDIQGVPKQKYIFKITGKGTKMN